MIYYYKIINIDKHSNEWKRLRSEGTQLNTRIKHLVRTTHRGYSRSHFQNNPACVWRSRKLLRMQIRLSSPIHQLQCTSHYNAYVWRWHLSIWRLASSQLPELGQMFMDEPTTSKIKFRVKSSQSMWGHWIKEVKPLRLWQNCACANVLSDFWFCISSKNNTS